MISTTININAAAANASLRAITMAANDKLGLHGVIAESVGKMTRKHLREKYLPRDKGGISFWGDVIESTETTATPEQATIALREIGIGLRYHGGDVTPGKSISSYTGKTTKALAVPSSKVPVADGRKIRPGRAGLLVFIHAARGRDTVGYLVEGVEVIAKHGPNKGKKLLLPKVGGALMYTLRTITRHKSDKGILPPTAQISEAAAMAIRDFIDSFE